MKRQVISVLSRLRLLRPVERLTRPLRAPAKRRGLRRFYGQFVRPGDLCFDVGANFGNRTQAFRALGARVVAVEPQGACLAHLRRAFGADPDVVIVPAAAAAAVGTAELVIAHETTETATLSERWRTEGRWNALSYDRTETVPTTTLDALIAGHGLPAFVKIDVEGFEESVLAGLSRPLPALSFEFAAEFLDQTERCLARLEELGRARFNLSFADPLRLLSADWVSGAELRAMLRGIVAADRQACGDVYVRGE